MSISQTSQTQWWKGGQERRKERGSLDVKQETEIQKNYLQPLGKGAA